MPTPEDTITGQQVEAMLVALDLTHPDASSALSVATTTLRRWIYAGKEPIRVDPSQRQKLLALLEVAKDKDRARELGDKIRRALRKGQAAAAFVVARLTVATLALLLGCSTVAAHDEPRPQDRYSLGACRGTCAKRGEAYQTLREVRQWLEGHEGSARADYFARHFLPDD